MAEVDTQSCRRAHVRLNIARGILSLHQSEESFIVCLLMDISEGGCRCRVPVSEFGDSAENWRKMLKPGARYVVGVSSQPFLRRQFFEAEIRWVSLEDGIELVLGIRFSGMSPEQVQELRFAIKMLQGSAPQAK